MTINQIINKITKAKTLKTVKKYGERFGVKFGNTKDINKAKNRVINAINNERRNIKEDLIKHQIKVENNPKIQAKKVNRLYNQRNKIINKIDINIQQQIFNLTKDLTKASNQMKYLKGFDVKLNSTLTTTSDSDAPLKLKKIGELRGTNHKVLIDQLTKSNNELLNNYSKFAKPDKQFTQMIEQYLDEYTESGYLLESEKEDLLNKMKKFNYVKQSYFLNQIVSTSKERYRVDEDVDDDLKLKYNKFINDMIEGINNIM